MSAWEHLGRQFANQEETDLSLYLRTNLGVGTDLSVPEKDAEAKDSVCYACAGEGFDDNVEDCGKCDGTGVRTAMRETRMISNKELRVANQRAYPTPESRLN